MGAGPDSDAAADAKRILERNDQLVRGEVEASSGGEAEVGGHCAMIVPGGNMLRLSNWIKRAVFVGIAACAALFAGAYPAGAATAPSLGSAQSFAVLGGTTVTNTGPTTIGGDLGVSPGSSITGAGSITLTGATHAHDAVALQAQSDVTTAYNALAGAPCTQSFNGTAVEVGGQTLTPGVYCYSSSAQLTGTLTLNAEGDGNAVFIFKTVSTITTASNSSVVMINGGQPCNVFWQIGSSATLGTSTAFIGNIFALTSISLTNRATVSGRALARNGAVTMDTNTVSNATCSGGSSPTATSTASTSVATTTASASPVASTPFATPSSVPSQPTSAATPTPPRVIAGPNTGSGPAARDSNDALWAMALVASVAGSLALGLSVRAYQSRR